MISSSPIHARPPAAPPPQSDVRYKIWVAIERIELDADGDETYEDIGLPDPIGVHSTLAAAQRHLRMLPGWEPEGSDHAEDSAYR
jgi:hypothetical protein